MRYTFQEYVQKLLSATGETLYMVFVSTVIAAIFGTAIGIVVAVTAKNGIRPNKPLNAVFEVIVNLGRSVPFIILLILLIPFTRFLVGTALGTSAAIVPLTIAAIPFVARVVDSALKEVDAGVVEASQSMGDNAWRTVFCVMIPESLPSLLRGLSLTVINLIGYSAMAGTVGGGGLGDLAYKDGYVRYDTMTIVLAVVILIVMVQLIQWIFNFIVWKIDKKNKA